MTTKPIPSETQLLNIFAALDAYRSTDERWEATKATSAEAKAAMEEAEEALTGATAHAKDAWKDHDATNEIAVDARISEMFEAQQSLDVARAKFKAEKSNRDSLAKQRGNLMEGLITKLEQARSGGDLFSKGDTLPADGWQRVAIESLVGGLHSQPFESCSSPMDTVGDFLVQARDPQVFRRLLTEQAFDDGQLQHVAREIRIYVEREGHGRAWPKKFQAFLDGEVGRTSAQAAAVGHESDAGGEGEEYGEEE